MRNTPPKIISEYAFYLYDDCVRLPQRAVYLTATEDIKSVRLMRTGQEIPFKTRQPASWIISDVDRNTGPFMCRLINPW